MERATAPWRRYKPNMWERIALVQKANTFAPRGPGQSGKVATCVRVRLPVCRRTTDSCEEVPAPTRSEVRGRHTLGRVEAPRVPDETCGRTAGSKTHVGEYAPFASSARRAIAIKMEIAGSC